MFDSSEWQTVASGTPEDQQRIAYRQALQILGRPIVYVVGTLFELGLVAVGTAFEATIRTPERAYRVTLTVEDLGEVGQ